MFFLSALSLRQSYHVVSTRFVLTWRTLIMCLFWCHSSLTAPLTVSLPFVFSKATKPYMLDRNKSQKYKIRFCTLGNCSCEPAPLVQCLFSPSSPSDPQQWSRWGKTMINDQWDPFNGQKRWSELLSVTTVDVFSVCLWVKLTCRLYSHVWDDEDHAGEQGGYMLSGKLCQFPQQPPVSTEWCQVGTH